MYSLWPSLWPGKEQTMKRSLDHKRILRRWLFSPLTLIVLLIAVVIFGRGVYRVFEKERLSSEYLVSAQNDLKKVQEREVALNKSVDYLKTSEGVEAELRKKFRVVKEGEQVAVIVTKTPEISLNVQTAAPATFWSKVKGWFGFGQ